MAEGPHAFIARRCRRLRAVPAAGDEALSSPGSTPVSTGTPGSQSSTPRSGRSCRPSAALPTPASRRTPSRSTIVCHHRRHDESSMESRLGLCGRFAALRSSPRRAKTKIVQSEGNKQPGEAPPRKILVLVVASDPKVRAAFEEVIAGRAVPPRRHRRWHRSVSFPELPKERGPFEAKLVAEGIRRGDGLTSGRTGGQARVEGRTRVLPERLPGHGLLGRVLVHVRAGLRAGLPRERNDREGADRSLADVGSLGAKGRLVWSGTSQTLDPTTAPQAAREVGAAVAKALAKAKLI